MRWWLLASTLIPVVVFSIGCMMPACGCGKSTTDTVLVDEDDDWQPPEQPRDETGDTGTAEETGETGDTGEIL